MATSHLTPHGETRASTNPTAPEFHATEVEEALARGDFEAASRLTGVSVKGLHKFADIVTRIVQTSREEASHD